MRQQFENSRETLVSHLQNKLSLLKQQRDEYVNRKGKQENHQKSEKVNISDYLKNQGNGMNKQEAKAAVIPKQYQVENVTKVQPKSRIEMYHQKKQAQQKCRQLEQLYKRKRQLESIGISENDPTKIKNLYDRQQTRKKIQRHLNHQKREQQIRRQKEKVISQELTKAKQFLKEGKVKSKLKKVQNEYSYKMLLSKQQGMLNEYEELLYSKKPSLLQQQRLIEISFNFLKMYSGKAEKRIIKEYLLANPQFSNKFCITKVEIMRDLEVYETKQNGYLDFTQFYEFVKSIEITNKNLHPTKNYKAHNKAAKDNTAKQQILNSKPNDSKQMQEYLKKVFVYLDQNKQKLVERQRIEIALKKGLLFDSKKCKNISKEAIMQFGEQIGKTKQRIKSLEYYKTLDMKYIGLDELIDLYQKYMKDQSRADLNQEESLKEQSEQNTENIHFQEEQKKQKEEQQANASNGLTDFEKYGWGDNVRERQTFAQLKQVDHYYNQVADKYGNEIHFNGFEHYRENFDRFNECIKQMSREKKGQNIYRYPDVPKDGP